MVGEAVEDLVEVEPAADVAGDPPERVRALQLMRHVGGRRGGPDDAADRGGRDPDQLPLRLGRRIGPAPDEEQDAPRLRVAGDRGGDLDARLVRGREVILRVRVDDARRLGQRGTQDAERARELDEGLAGSAGERGRNQPAILPPPGRDEAGAERVADRLDRGVERRVRTRERFPDRGPADLRQLTDQREHRLVVLERDDRAATSSRGRTLVERVDRGQDHGRVAGGQEPLQVAHPVAPVTARVDPVVAQAPGVAPGSDGVRVYAQHLGRPRDRQGRVEWSRMEQINLRQCGSRQDS